MQTLTLSDIGLNHSNAARSARASAEAREMTARHLLLAARASLGFIFVVLGANGFGHFLPNVPEHLAGAPLPELAAIVNSPLGSALQMVVGALLLANRCMPLAIWAGAPLIANLIAAHVLASHTRVSLPMVALVFELYLIWTVKSGSRDFGSSSVTRGAL
jgi:cytochrome c biogenesis protein CcdA